MNDKNKFPIPLTLTLQGERGLSFISPPLTGGDEGGMDYVNLFGYLLSNFLSRDALIAAVNAGLKLSGLIGRFVELIIFLLAVTMALEQLDIGRGTIVIAFAIIFGGIVLALAIAFGLGGRDIAKEYLEKKIRGEEKKDDISHL